MKTLPYFSDEKLPLIQSPTLILMTAHGCPTLIGGQKYFTVVGPYINPYDLGDVIFTVSTRAQPVSDNIVIEKGLSAHGELFAIPGPLE